jgi:hypothetical protein
MQIADTDFLDIALIGHKSEQFNNIEQRSYLKRILLHNLQYKDQKYASNTLAESRFLICEDVIFKDTAEVVGSISASWNTKYYPSRIDSITTWYNWPIINKIRNDPSLVCCATLCYGAYSKPNDPLWEKNFQQHFRTIFKNSQWVTDLLYEILGLKYDGLRPTPYANQILCHKSVFNEYRIFIKSHIDDIISNFAPKLDHNYSSSFDAARPLAYILEEASMLWWSSRNFVFIPCAQINNGWYK